MLKDMHFYHSGENIKNSYWTHDYMLLKKIVHKVSEFIGNKIVDAVTKSNDDNIDKQEPVEEIFYQKKAMKYQTN